MRKRFCRRHESDSVEIHPKILWTPLERLAINAFRYATDNNIPRKNEVDIASDRRRIARLERGRRKPDPAFIFLFGAEDVLDYATHSIANGVDPLADRVDSPLRHLAGTACHGTNHVLHGTPGAIHQVPDKTKRVKLGCHLAATSTCAICGQIRHPWSYNQSVSKTTIP